MSLTLISCTVNDLSHVLNKLKEYFEESVGDTIEWYLAAKFLYERWYEMVERNYRHHKEFADNLCEYYGYLSTDLIDHMTVHEWFQLCKSYIINRNKPLSEEEKRAYHRKMLLLVDGKCEDEEYVKEIYILEKYRSFIFFGLMGSGTGGLDPLSFKDSMDRIVGIVPNKFHIDYWSRERILSRLLRMGNELDKYAEILDGL